MSHHRSTVGPTTTGSSNTVVVAPTKTQHEAPPPIVMRLNRTWNIDCPPAKMAILHGKLVPTAKSTFTLGGRLMIKSKRRRIAIEIHGPDKEEHDVKSSGRSRSSSSRRKKSGSSDPPPLRGFKRENRTMSEVMQLSKELMDDDKIVIRILKPRKVWGFSRDPEDSSDDSDSDSDVKKVDEKSTNTEKEEPEGWVEYRKYGLDEIVNEELIGRHKNIFEANMGLGNSQERRELKFDSEEQALEFWNELKQLKALVKERAQIRLAIFQESQRETEATIKRTSELLRSSPSLRDLTPKSEIQLLIEIVSATNLPVADRLKHSTDPYVIVYLGQQEIHRTQFISRTINPVWTVATGCFCLLSIGAQDFFQASNGLTFVIKDKDTLSASDDLGRVSVPQSTLLQLTGEERVALPLNILKAHKFKPSKTSTDRGVVFLPTLYFRARPATKEDRRFMKKIFAVQKKKLLGVYADQTFIGPQKERVNIFKRESKVVDGVRKYRVKPHPDPNRPEQETKWIDNETLLAETMKPTHKWTEAGSGSLGKLYLEILKCDGLPNMDIKVEGKTDAFCCIVYEDAIVNTDAIHDTLKPRWVPWCQRGFMFRMAHPSSQVLIGVFDYDSEKNLAFNSHDAIGRVNIDVTNFRRDTEYVLTYDLHRSVLACKRQVYGTMTVRVRLEYDSYRAFVKGSLDLPPINYINLPQKHAFKTSYFVVHGEENLDRFDMDAITAYRNEIEGYLVILYYLKKAAITILLWRGHFDVKLGKYKTQLPIHSLVAFIMGITMIENFNLIPSYFLFSIAWLLLATNEFRQKHPSPWHGSLSYMQLWYAVMVNKAPPVVVEAHENEGAIRAYEEEMKQRKEEEVARGRQRRERLQQIDALFQEERDSATEAFQEDIATKLRELPTLNPLAKAKAYLLPIQRNLGQICIALRITSSIVLWDESIFSFIIVNVCLFLGLVFIWFPWSFVLRWMIRISIWVFLGPWMKLVDILYVQKQTMDGEDESVFLQKLFDEQLETKLVTRDVMMRAKEEIVKMRAMKRYMFGRFVTRVPRLKEYRYSDVPLAESYAKPVKASSRGVVVERRSHGQTLAGQMIPMWGDEVDREKLEKKQQQAKENAKNIEKKNEAMLEAKPILVDEKNAKKDD